MRIKNAKKRQREYFSDQCTLTLDLNHLEQSEREKKETDKKKVRSKKKTIEDVKEQEEREIVKGKKKPVQMLGMGEIK